MKPKTVAVLVSLAVVASVMAGAGHQATGRIILLAVAGGLAAAGASVLNNYLDRDNDALLSRTRDRPLPAGRVGGSTALLMGMSLVIASLVVAWNLGYPAVSLLAIGMAVYIVAYTMWLKKSTPFGVVAVGLSGAMAILAAWFSVADRPSAAPFLLALILLVWAPGHFWSQALVHPESYGKRAVPMFPLWIGDKKVAMYILVNSILLNLVAVLPYFFDPLGKVYLLGAAHLSGMYIISSVRLWRKPEPAWARRHYRLSVICLLGIFLFMAIDMAVQGLWVGLR